MTINVLVVDDSALIRRLLTEIIEQAPDMTCVGAAKDAYVARDMVNRLTPDVITLDIEMPGVDGLTFLEKLMRARPTPVVMISTLTERGAEATMRALELGAVDFLPKPKLGVVDGVQAYATEICDKIRAAATAKVRLATAGPVATASQALPPTLGLAGIRGTEKLIGIGASTGGTEAIKEVLLPLPADMPAVLITQHMPAGFTTSFAARLDRLCALRVKEAEQDERILPGHAYLAPGGWHLLIKRFGADYRIALSDGPPVNRHRPSVDVMFDSMASAAAANCIGVVLTGMGRDGAEGLLHLREVGAVTAAQDESSSLVYGMPKAAAENGAAHHVVNLPEFAGFLVDTVRRMGAGSRV